MYKTCRYGGITRMIVIMKKICFALYQTGCKLQMCFLWNRFSCLVQEPGSLDCSFSAAEIRSPGSQMRPMSPPGDPRPYYRLSVWRPMDSLGFAENVLEWKWRDDSTDALISNVYCALSKYGSRLVHFDHFWLVAWSQQIIDWRTTQNWDGPINHQP